MYKRAASGWAKHFDFQFLDMLCLEVSFFLAYVLRHGLNNPLEQPIYRNMSLIIVMVDFVLLVMMETLKDVMQRGFYKEFTHTISHVVLLILIVTGYIFAVQEGDDYSRITIFVMGFIYLFLSYLVRVLWKMQLFHKGKNSDNNTNNNRLLIISSEKRAREIAESMEHNNFGHYRIIGWAFHDRYKIGRRIENIPVVASHDTVAEYIKCNWVDEVLIAVSANEEFPRELIEQLVGMGVTVHLNLDKSTSIEGMKQVVGDVGGLMVITNSINTMSARQYISKRILDVMGALVGCFFTCILYVVLAPQIKKASPGPVIFKQTRIGQNGKPFTLYKFRSMYLDAEERKAELMSQNRMGDGHMFKMEYDPRVIGNYVDENGKQHTGIGEFIRRHSLDEFPQFFNVLKNDMSLVGTRPPTVDEVAGYEKHHLVRLAVKPGITGMWQVSGRSDVVDFEKVVKMDADYISNWSLGLDLKILMKTLKVVGGEEGAM